MAKLKKTFRIEEESFDELVKLADEWGVSQGAAIERAIHSARQSPDGGGAPDGPVLEALTAQLAVKDEQISELLQAVRGAQALHHETATKALEFTEQKERRGLLQRLFHGRD